MLKINETFNLKVSDNFTLTVCNDSETKQYRKPKLSRFEVYHGKDGKIYWVLKSTNGRTILRSVKGYDSLRQSIENVNMVLMHGTNLENYEVETENKKEGGLYYFLINPNDGLNLAISGNGKGYNLKSSKRTEYNIALKQQVLFNGVEKGITACVKNTNAIIDKNKPVLYFPEQ